MVSSVEGGVIQALVPQRLKVAGQLGVHGARLAMFLNGVLQSFLNKVQTQIQGGVPANRGVQGGLTSVLQSSDGAMNLVQVRLALRPFGGDHFLQRSMEHFTCQSLAANELPEHTELVRRVNVSRGCAGALDGSRVGGSEGMLIAGGRQPGELIREARPQCAFGGVAMEA